METYFLTLLKKETVATRTQAFFFEKPENFMFKAGQYLQVRLTEDKNDSHTFSIASAPHEDMIMCATRISPDSDFKRRMAELTEGEKVYIEAPGGQFTLPKEEDIPLVFLAGGIGITTIRSMVRYEEYRNTERPIALFYSNRKPEEAAFLHELESITLPQYRLIATMTGLEGSHVEGSHQEWNGETGYINEKMIRAYVPDVSKPLYYVVGPPRFVEAMVDLLHSLNEVPSTHVKSEDFAGY